MLISYKKPKGRFFIVGKPGGSPAVTRHISINVSGGLGTLFIDGTAVTLDADNTWETDIADGTQITMRMTTDSDHNMCCWYDPNGVIPEWQGDGGWCYTNPATITVSGDYAINTQIDTYHFVSIYSDPSKYALKINGGFYNGDYYGWKTSGNCDKFECVPNVGYEFIGWTSPNVDSEGYWCYGNNEEIRPIVNYIVPNNEIWYKSQGWEILWPITSPQDENGNYLSLESNTYSDGYGRLVYEGDIHRMNEGFFDNDRKLLQIALPGGLKEVSNECIINCEYLTSIALGNSLEKLDDRSFANNEYLTGITIPPSFGSAYIGTVDVGYTFSGCTRLIYIDMQANHFSYDFGGYDNLFAGLDGTYGTFRISYQCELYDMFVTQFQNYGWDIESY